MGRRRPVWRPLARSPAGGAARRRLGRSPAPAPPRGGVRWPSARSPAGIPSEPAGPYLRCPYGIGVGPGIGLDRGMDKRLLTLAKLAAASGLLAALLIRPPDAGPPLDELNPRPSARAPSLARTSADASPGHAPRLVDAPVPL